MRASTSIDPGGVHRFDPPLNPPGVPEYFMGVAGIEFDGDDTIAVLQTGPWLSWDGRAVAVGSLGVLFDNVLAYPMLSGASAQTALVSTQITIDALAPIGVDAGPLTARGTMLARDERSAFATAELRNAAGVPVAVATQRGRFVPIVDAPGYDYEESGVGTDSTSLADLMWPGSAPPRVTNDGRLEFRIAPRLGNHMNSMHGGISLLFAEWAALAAVRAQGGDLTTASIRVSYARPIPVGTTATFETSVQHLGQTTANVNVVGRTDAGKCGVVALVTLH